MHKRISIFIVTLLAFATGTSAIGYSLAKETYDSAKTQKPAYKIVETKKIPWYCSPIVAKVKAQFADEKSGYYVGGYNTVPGYQPPKPGVASTTPPSRPAELISMPAKLQPNEFAAKWQSLLAPCPVGHKLDEELIVKKCSVAVQKKLDGNPLPAESAEQYQTCAQVLAPSIWNAKISQKICSAFYLYENDCTSAQTAKRACTPLSKYLTTAGVDRASIPKTQSDTIYLCKDVYPKP